MGGEGGRLPVQRWVEVHNGNGTGIAVAQVGCLGLAGYSQQGQASKPVMGLLAQQVVICCCGVVQSQAGVG